MSQHDATDVDGVCDCAGCIEYRAGIRSRQLEVARNYLRSRRATLWHAWNLGERTGFEAAANFIVDNHNTLSGHLRRAAAMGIIEKFEEPLDTVTPPVLLSCQRQPRRPEQGATT